MITRPLDLESHLSRPPRDLDVMHWVSAAGVALFFLLAGSRFVLAPGLLVGGEATDFALPRHGKGAQNVRTASELLSYRRDNVILFGGGVYKRLEELREPLRAYAKAHEGAVLLVLADRQVSVVSVWQLAEMATEAGFAGVQLAGQAGEAGATQPEN
jgi:biopolymer transport protein ExbD